MNLIRNCKQISDASSSAIVATTPKRNRNAIKMIDVIKPNIKPKIALTANSNSDTILKTNEAIKPVTIITNKKIKNIIPNLLSLRNSLLALLSYAKFIGLVTNCVE